MKLKVAILALVVAATGSSAFGQGFINFQGANPIFDVNNLVGQGVGNGRRATVGMYNVAFLWNANTNQSLDTLPALGGTPSSKASGANKQSATNGVYNTAAALSGVFSSLLANGWQWGTNSGSSTLISTANTANGSYNYNTGTPVGLAGSVSGSTIQMIIVAWNSSAGLTAILSGNVNFFGYSNPILYALGLNSADAPAFIQQTGSGMNEFGVAPVPEPTTFALAGLGIAGLLAFRRRK